MEQEQNQKCEYCGSKTHESIVKMGLWQGDNLFVIEDVPALVCEECFEQFYDERTAYKIDTLRGEKFPVEKSRRVMEVPVFSLKDFDIPETADTEGPAQQSFTDE